LGGFPQIAFYTILSVLAFGIFKMVGYYKDGYPKNCIRAGLGLVIIVCIGFSLSAIQILPTLEFSGLSTRGGGLDYEFATVESFPPKHLLTFFIPQIFGTNADGSFWISDSDWKFWEYCGYTGICALILIIGNIRRLVADREGIFFSFMLLIALFLALGKYNPLYKLIYLLPGFNTFRVPAQILFLYVFSIAVLAGKGLDCLKNISIPFSAYRVAFTCCSLLLVLILWVHVHPDSFFTFLFKITNPTGLIDNIKDQVSSIVTHSILRSFVVLLIILFVLFFYMKKRISYAAGSSFLIVISIVDLGLFSLPMVQTANITSMIDRGKSIRQIKRDSNPTRAVINDRCFIENAGLWYRFHDIQGYDPLILKRYMKYIHMSQHIPPDDKVVNMHYLRDFDNNLIDLLNLKYIVDCSSRTIIKRSTHVPRAYVVRQVVQKGEREILDYMMRDQFDPLKTVVFEKENPVTVIDRQRGEDFKASCSILRYENEHILIRAEANQQCYLVLSEIFYPGWRAKVDGKRVPIIRGNYMFRVVPLERGDHEVHLYFISQPFYIGTIVSLLTLLCSLSFIIGGQWRAHQK
jgi:hypothetical protein